MDLNELQNEVDRDLKIDDTELDLESIRTPQLHNKYLKHYTTYSLRVTLHWKITFWPQKVYSQGSRSRF